MKLNRQILDQYPEIELEILKYIFESNSEKLLSKNLYLMYEIKSVETLMFHKEKILRVIYLDDIGTECYFDICLKYKYFNDILMPIIRDNKLNQIL